MFNPLEIGGFCFINKFDYICPVMKKQTSILTVIFVSIAILGQVVCMYVFQTQEKTNSLNELALIDNNSLGKPSSYLFVNRKGELVDSDITES